MLLFMSIFIVKSTKLHADIKIIRINVFTLHFLQNVKYHCYFNVCSSKDIVKRKTCLQHIIYNSLKTLFSLKLLNRYINRVTANLGVSGCLYTQAFEKPA